MGINYSGTIERMRQAAGVKNNSEIAGVIGVTPQALSNYKKKGEIPSDLVIKFAKMFGLSVTWLMTGEGEMQLAAGGTRTKGRISIELAEGGEPAIPVMLSAMSPEELIYAGKLLKVLRGKDESGSAGIKNAVDAFLKTLDKPRTFE